MFFRLFGSICCLLICVPATQADTATPTDDQWQVSIGVEGFVKLGHWFPIFISAESPGASPQFFEVQAPDGDGKQVLYRGQLLPCATQDQWQAWARLGRNSGELLIRLLDSDRQEIWKQVISLGSGADLTIAPATQRLLVTLEAQPIIGDALRTSTINATVADGGTVLTISDSSKLPVNWLAYDAVRVIIIGSTDIQMMHSISDQQWSSLDRWVRDGGQLVFSGGPNGPEILGPEQLGRFLPGELGGLAQLQDSWQIEAFANSRDQLIPRDGTPITVTKLQSVVGVTEKSQDGVPLVVRAAHGFGQVVFSAISLDQGPIVEWPGRDAYLGKLMQRESEAELAASESPQSTRFSHRGFDDLSGQLRIPLEQFNAVSFVTFTWVAILIGLYILCIGPGDYFVLRRLFGRMEFTWITFSLITLLFCGLAILMNQWTRPTTMQQNQLEIVDIDAANKTVRSHVWANVYSPQTTSCKVTTAENSPLGFDTSSDCVISWLGLPGTGLGGMQSQSQAVLSRGLPYFNEFLRGGAGDSAAQATLTDIPLQVSSTKSLLVRWQSDCDLNIRSRLRLNQRIQRLDGTITNPFPDTPIRNCRVMFENWTYKLDRGLEPGETVDIATEMKEQTARNYLTRRVRENDKGKNTSWDPTDSNIYRIADMMMFFSMAGGRDYTKLTHDYHPSVDLSEQLFLQRAILVGEIQGKVTDLQVGDANLSGQYDRVTTLIRISIPVDYQDTDSNGAGK